MSTRFYPLYQRGNPQLRVFLPNFWLKLVEPSNDHPPNIVQFHCSMEMTKQDVRNYLKKIYNIDTVDVRTRIQLGRIGRRPGMTKYIVKEDDYKVAYAILPKDQKFVFPELFKNEDMKKEEEFEKKSFDEMKAGQKKYLAINNKPGVPGWFSI